MSNDQPPYPGQPDPHNPSPWGPPVSGQPVSGQPVSGHPGYPPPGGQPGYPPPPGQPGYPSAQGQPGYPPPGGPSGYPPPPGQPDYLTPAGQPGYAPYGAPMPPQKSNKGLIIGLSVGVVVLLLLVVGGVAGLIFAGDDDETVVSPPPSTQQPGGETSPQPGTAPSEAAPDPGSNNGVTARYSSDFEAVCEGGAILNAAAYSSPASAKAYAFSNSPDRPTSWSSKSVGYDKPYYAKSSDYATVSVVGCLSFVQGSEATGKKCDLKGSDDKVVTVDYVSSRFTLTFYAAKTGQKIGDGGTINAPATRCPMFVTYNKVTKKAYASPDTGAIEAAFTKFLS